MEETIKETLTKLEETNQLEVDSQTNLPEELDLTQEDNKGKDKELHWALLVTLLRMLRCLKRR